jgi:uncharacterized membrane protein SpoIIM required for sporulation
MITQDDFVRARRPEWDELDGILTGEKALHRLSGPTISRVATLYRSICSDLMRARGAGFGADLVAYLDNLAARAHNVLYTAPPYRMAAVWELFLRDFPRTLRRRARLFAFSAALFFIPGLVGFVGSYSSRQFAAQVLPEAMLSGMEEMYSKGFDEGRDPGTNSAMAGFYVYNNVGIAFRCFATGVLFGLGSVFFLVYNGLVIGTVLGFVTQAGYGKNILTFVCGHSPFELTAIVIAGAAGLQMGYALVHTSGMTRWGSLRAQAREIAQLVLGAAGMLLIAAAIEGFWSPSAAKPPIKWIVAAMLTLLVTLYLALAGRGVARTKRSKVVAAERGLWSAAS